MTFRIFTEHAVKEEVREMIFSLGKDMYAISDLDREIIKQYADELHYGVKLHRLKSGKVKVTRL